MKKISKSNSGFTLIELIIAIAMLAFVMTAVSSFMGSGVLGYKKAKADIAVHNSAQETYNNLVDTAMQANDIIIYGYTAKNPGEEVVFGLEGEAVNIELSDSKTYFVRDNEQAEYVKNSIEYDGNDNFVLYSSLPAGTKIYVEKIIIESSVPFDPAYATEVEVGKYKNFLASAGGTEVVDAISVEERVLADGSYETVESVTGQIIYSKNDTLRTIFTFDAEKLYCETEYAYMTALNDCYTGGAGESLEDFVYSESFNYSAFKTTDASGTEIENTISGCVVTVNAADGTFSFDLKFSDKNMTYNSQGMVLFRNSYVLRAKN